MTLQRGYSIESLITGVVEWASAQPAIDAVILVGSHARGTARPDSDVDLMILTPTPEMFLAATDWLSRFGRVERQTRERWGRVTSLRVWFAAGSEVEFSFATPAWAAAPLDEGTRRVIHGGTRVLFDRTGVCRTLNQA